MQFVCISAAYSVLFLILALFGATGPSSVLSDIDNIHLMEAPPKNVFLRNCRPPPLPPYLGIIPKKRFFFRGEKAKMYYLQYKCHFPSCRSMMGGILCGIDTIWKVQTSEPRHAAHDIYAMF